MYETNLIIEGINKSFEVNKEKKEILVDINIGIGKGEFLSIVGHSGCGKSTLLKIIAGLVQADEGKVILDDKIINKPDTDRGMVFQEHRLFPWLNIRDNVSLGLHSLDKKKREKITNEHLELVKLQEFANAYPHQLSGGMSQRAAIARGLVNSPGILLLDEPFGALDALTRIQMQQEILRIWEHEQTTMILVTHDIDEAVYLADRVVILSSRPGKVEEIIPIDLPRPRDRSSLEFVKIKHRVYEHFFKDAEILPDYNI